jgi:HlyD family secretion protein
VEPSAFTKISALGVEEQRVWVVIDILDAWESRTALGDGFELEPRIVIWESEAVTKIPTGALFRQGEAWAAFAVEGERAVLRTIEPGPSNGLETAISSGLTPGEAVILHPSEHVADGVLVTTRP